MPSNAIWPRPEDAPLLEDLAKCVRCGLCVTACPTFVITGLETESPRGRISMARSIADGEQLLTPAIQGHWELCLQCRACEAVCPSGVPFGRIMEGARAQLDADAPTGKMSRRLRKMLLRTIIARPRVLAVAVAPGRWLAASWLRRMVLRRVSGKLGRLGALEAQLPAHPGRPFRAGDRAPGATNAVAKGILFTGCIMGELFGNVHRATMRVFARAGIPLEAPAAQGCCGALHAHDGDIDFARTLARRNIEQMEHSAPLPIIVNSAGCAAAMKEYGELLSQDAEWRHRAHLFSARVFDPSEYLVKHGTGLEFAETTSSERITYQDPCHLAHAQRIREQPRALIRQAGCEIVETPGGDMCCGAAGIYSLVQPQMSAQLRSKKADQFRDAKPDIVVTANPGCQMQYEAAVREAGIRARVLHVMELLDERLL